MRVHAIVSSYGPHEFGLHSPQVPALFAGGTTIEEFTDQALVALLAEAGAPKEYDLVEHRQMYSSRDDREWFIRACTDRHPVAHEERTVTLELLRDLIDATPKPIDDAAKAATGEALFIVARLDDTIGWIAEQLDPSGVATLVAPIGSGLITIDISTSRDHDDYVAVDGSVTVRELLEQVHSYIEPAQSDFLTEHPLPTVRRARELVSI